MSTSTYDGRAVINGQRVAALDGQTFDCISPVDGRLLTQVARCAQADVDAAVQAARRKDCWTTKFAWTTGLSF